MPHRGGGGGEMASARAWRGVRHAAWMAAAWFAAHAVADPVPMTQRDFLVPGSQPGDAHAGAFQSPQLCSACHANTGSDAAPYDSWRGSLMAQAGRDPLFYAQLAT